MSPALITRTLREHRMCGAVAPDGSSACLLVKDHELASTYQVGTETGNAQITVNGTPHGWYVMPDEVSLLGPPSLK